MEYLGPTGGGAPWSEDINLPRRNLYVEVFLATRSLFNLDCLRLMRSSSSFWASEVAFLFKLTNLSCALNSSRSHNIPFLY